MAHAKSQVCNQEQNLTRAKSCTSSDKVTCVMFRYYANGIMNKFVIAT